METMERLKQGLLEVAGGPADGAIPLSHQQKNIWFLTRFYPGSRAWNIRFTERFRGPLDGEALRKAARDLVQRHASLRTNFVDRDGTPVQVIHRTLPPEAFYSRISLSDLPPPERENRAAALARHEADTLFSISDDPLIRIRHLVLDDADHIVLLTIHHCVADGISLQLLWRDLADLYCHHADGRVQVTGPPVCQYHDYARWQQAEPYQAYLESQGRYWLEEFADPVPRLELPTVSRARSERLDTSTVIGRTLEKDLAGRLRRFSFRHRVPLSTTLLTALYLLLYRHGRQRDLVVGSLFSGRLFPELNQTIGYFINTLAIRVKIPDSCDIRRLLELVDEKVRLAHRNRDYPYDRLVRSTGHERRDGRQLERVLFNMVRGDWEREIRGGFAGLEKMHWAPDIPRDTENLDYFLTVTVMERGDGLAVDFEYPDVYFQRETVERMLGEYAALLEQMAADLSLPVDPPGPGEATPPERPEDRWNRTAAVYERDATIHGLFRRQVEKTPDAEAFREWPEDGGCAGGARITFGELDQASDRVAGFLAAAGFGRGSLAGVYLERSVTAVVGMLGILKTGGVYVPLDPAYPGERIELMMEDAGIGTVLTRRALKDELPGGARQVACLDEPMQGQVPAERLAAGSGAGDPVWVLFTSGSTGRPRGVQGLHRGAVNRLSWMWEAYPFTGPEMGCCTSSLNFVDSCWEVFGPLLRGVSSLIIPEATVKSPRNLIDALDSAGVTRITLVPSLLDLILQHLPDDGGALRRLNLWISSGEPLTGPLAALFRKKLPGRKLLNLYGSTEVSADVTCFDLDGHQGEGSVPIGRPIANTRIHILDRQQNLVPAGMEGELCVGGDGLAGGYLNDERQTGERFISKRFGGGPAERLFRTGDRARWLPDGNVEFLGRVDRQLSIHGNRVEPAEVEAALSGLPQVSGCVVVPCGAGNGTTKMAAFVTATAAVSTLALRGELRRLLPPFMIPHHIILLDSLPRTPNGKVDLRRLAALARRHEPRAETTRPPRSPMEKEVAEIWRSILRLEQVSLGDNFFHLGAGSLDVVQVIMRLEQRLNLRMNFDDFINQTLEQFAVCCEARAEGDRPGSGFINTSRPGAPGNG